MKQWRCRRRLRVRGIDRQRRRRTCSPTTIPTTALLTEPEPPPLTPLAPSPASAAAAGVKRRGGGSAPEPDPRSDYTPTTTTNPGPAPGLVYSTGRPDGLAALVHRPAGVVHVHGDGRQLIQPAGYRQEEEVHYTYTYCEVRQPVTAYSLLCCGIPLHKSTQPSSNHCRTESK